MMKIFRMLIGLIIFVFFFNTHLKSQDMWILPEVIPSSPTAYALGLYGKVPVGLYTGTPKVSIPLYSIETSGFSLPISLSYRSNGIRVDELPTNVGLSWSLMAGGVISRTLNDLTDEDYRTELIDAPFESDDMDSFLLNVCQSGMLDSQPDIFSFSVGDIAGKFFLDSEMQPRLIEPAPIKIELLPTFGLYETTSPSILITDEKGVKYWFGGLNAIEEGFYRTYGDVSGLHEPSTPAINSWFLTKIQLLNGDEINFEYDSEYVIYDGGVSQNISASKVVDIGEYTGLELTFTAAQHTEPAISRIYTNFSRIREINWKEGLVVFNYTPMYSNDILAFKKISSISVLSNEEKLIKNYELYYSEYETDNEFVNPDNDGLSGEVNAKRIFLEKVRLTSEESTLNEYILEYYNANKLPPRLSYAQDYWGFFNGKDNSDLIPRDLSINYINAVEDAELTYDLVNSMFLNVGGDRNPDASFGMNGMLKKITYPTGGSTNFEYESHSVYENEFRNPPYKSVDIEVETGEDGFGYTVSKYVTGIIPFTQEKIPVNFAVWEVPHDDINPDDWNNMRISIINVNTREYQPLYVYNSTTGLFNALPMPFDIRDYDYAQWAGRCVMNLYEGEEYEFSITLDRPWVHGSFSFKYFDTDGYYEMVNKEIGGVRLKRTVNNSINSGDEITEYFYGGINCLTCSSGISSLFQPAMSYLTLFDINSYLPDLGEDNVVRTTIITLSSNSLFSLNNSTGNHITYLNVVESIGENQEGGLIEHRFNSSLEYPSEPIGYPVLGMPFNNTFLNGKELQTDYYKKDGDSLIKVRSISNNYILNEILNYSIQGYGSSIRNSVTYSTQTITNLPGAVLTYSFTDNSYNIGIYNILSQWYYLNSTSVTDYDINGENPVGFTQSFNFDNPTHMQLSRKESVSSDGKLLVENIYYPDDVSDVTSLGEDLSINEIAAINMLKTQNRVSTPIQVESWRDNKKLSTLRTNYFDWGNGNVLPIDIQNSKEEDLLEDRIIFHSYYDNGNVQEVSKADGTHIVYIWGYNETYPIAKIENATYSEVISSVLNLQDKSNLDNDRTIGLVGNEGALRIALNNLRNLPSLSDALVTTYTYDPLIGVTSITDPRGETVYYEYDDFNRLEYVKDSVGNILSKNDYHYKNQ